MTHCSKKLILIEKISILYSNINTIIMLAIQLILCYTIFRRDFFTERNKTMKIKNIIVCLMTFASLGLFAGCAEEPEPHDLISPPETTVSEVETTTKKPAPAIEEIEKGTYEINNFRFNISEAFELTQKNKNDINFTGKKDYILLSFMGQPSSGNKDAIEYAESFAKILEESSEKVEYEEFENPFYECARIRTVRTPEKGRYEGIIDEISNLDYFVVKKGDSLLTFIVACEEEDIDLIDEYANYILCSLEYTGKVDLTDENSEI